MIIKIVFLTLLALNLNALINIPEQSKQLLVVTVKKLSQNTATLQAYEKIDMHWKKYLSPISVNLGRNGLGWSESSLVKFNHPVTDAMKKEGDGRSPAGLFKLISFFGYGKNRDFHLPYLQVNSSIICVDDSSSDMYNKIIKTENKKLFKSFEEMKRTDKLYKYGIVVGYNQKARKQKGSCIFIHIQRSKNSPTAGCTSMQEDRLIKLMRWLDGSKHPLLLQIPTSYLRTDISIGKHLN